MARLRFILGALIAAMPFSARAEQCPQPLGDALRLVLVTTATMDTHAARLQLFSRPSLTAPWTAVQAGETAVVGKAGLAWGTGFLHVRRGTEREKVEGDKRSPAGIFRIGPSFGFEAASLAGYIHVKARETVCVEDPSSPHYNTITRRADVDPAIKTDEMRATGLFRHGLFVDYPTDRANRRGSCIFIHIWQSAAKGTAGCIGLPERSIPPIQSFAQPGAVIAILPRTALDRLEGCLPVP